MKRLLVGISVFLLANALTYVAVPASVFASSQCECVLYLREVLGINIHGNAWTIESNIPTDQIRAGDVVLFSYAETGHAALITDIIQARPERPEIYLTIQESNFHHCTPDTRTISLSDPAIRGFYRPPQVSLLSPLSVSIGL